MKKNFAYQYNTSEHFSHPWDSEEWGDNRVIEFDVNPDLDKYVEMAKSDSSISEIEIYASFPEWIRQDSEYQQYKHGYLSIDGGGGVSLKIQSAYDSTDCMVFDPTTEPVTEKL